MSNTAEQLKSMYTALAHKEALIINDTKDIQALTRIMKNNARQLEHLVERRERTRKEIEDLKTRLEVITEG